MSEDFGPTGIDPDEYDNGPGSEAAICRNNRKAHEYKMRVFAERQEEAKRVEGLDAEIERLKAALELVHPSEVDLDWVSKAIQRHTGGIDEWWEENRGQMPFRKTAEIIINIWEAGRIKTEKVIQALKPIEEV